MRCWSRSEKRSRAAGWGAVLALVLGSVFPGSAVAQQSGSGLQYFGYFDSSANWVGTGHTDPNSDPAYNYMAGTRNDGAAHVSWIAHQWLGDGGVTACANQITARCNAENWYVDRLVQAQSLGMPAMLEVTNLFIDKSNKTGSPPYLRQDFEAQWTAFANRISPYTSTVLGFYLFDEPYSKEARDDKVNARKALNTVAKRIKASFPGKPVATFFDYASIQDDGLTPNDPDTPNVDESKYTSFEDAGVPEDLDWVGVDCYYNDSTFESCGGRSLVWYTNRLKQLMSPGQRMILAPQAYFEAVPSPQGYADALAHQPQLLCRLGKEMGLALSDPLFIGIFPFTYQSHYRPQSGEKWIGAQNMPRVQREFVSVGENLRNGARLLQPACAVETSGNSSYSNDQFALDGDISTAWNAGAGASSAQGTTQWIQLDLGELKTVNQLRLRVAQSPSGLTDHVIYAGPSPNSLTVLTGFNQSTQDGDWLEWTGSARDVRYVRIVTKDSPSWVAWYEIQVYQGLAPTVPPAQAQPQRVYPLPIDSSVSTTSAADRVARLNVADADPLNHWSSGRSAPQWVELDLGRPITVKKIRLLTSQWPSGVTLHEVYGGPSPEFTSMSLLGTFSGDTVDQQWLELNGSFDSVRYLRVITQMSPSWVAWRDIEVYR